MKRKPKITGLQTKFVYKRKEKEHLKNKVSEWCSGCQNGIGTTDQKEPNRLVGMKSKANSYRVIYTRMNIRICP